MSYSATPERRGTALARFAGETVLWLGVSVAFLAMYAERPGASAVSAMAPAAGHLYVLGALLGLGACVRGALWLTLPTKWARWAVAAMGATLLYVLIAYYVLVLIGLESWGRVVSWQLIRTYAFQAPDLLRSIGVEVLPAVAALACSFLAVLLLFDRCLTRNDWILHVLRRVSSRPIAISLVLFVGSLGALVLYQWSLSPPVRVHEPFALTFFGGQGLQTLQSHKATDSPILTAQAEQDRQSYTIQPMAHRRNVFLVVVDALRADHMGVYGYPRDTTPYLSSLQHSGALQVVKHAASICAESSCGLLAIARSKFSHEMTARDFALHEILRRQGYGVHMILGGDHTHFYGLREAYGAVDSYVDGSTASGFYMNDDRLVLDRLQRLPAWDGRPVMMQLHLMSAHPLARRDSTAAAPFQPSRPYVAYVTQRQKAGERYEAEINHYDNGVVQFDRVMAQIFELLQRKGYLDDAMFIITADHGEMLGEHGDFGHAKGVREAALRIPLAIAHFGAQRSKVTIDIETMASQVDIAPTVLADLGLPVPKSWAGRPLQQPRQERFLYFRQAEIAGLYDATGPGKVLKYTVNTSTGALAAFDVVADPQEHRDIFQVVEAARRHRWQRALLPVTAVITD